MRLTRGRSGSGSTNAGIRDDTAQAKRPPKLRGKVMNDVSPMVRSAIMPPPTTDTRQPRMSSSHTTSSPSNKFKPMTSTSTPHPRAPKEGGASPYPSKTPKAESGGKFRRGRS